MKIYTRTGDSGETSLYSGERVFKGDPLFETLGSVDELNAWLGVIHDSIKSKTIKALLRELQLDLFHLGSDIATRPHRSVRRITADDSTRLERSIDQWTANLPALKNFIYPGGCLTASLIHLARTVCRRAERQAFILARSVEVNPHIPVYLNRLSDLLFVLARTAHRQEKKKEQIVQL